MFTEPCIEIIELELSDILLASNEWIGWFGDFDDPASQIDLPNE